MRGVDHHNDRLFSYVRLDSRVPSDAVAQGISMTDPLKEGFVHSRKKQQK